MVATLNFPGNALELLHDGGNYLGEGVLWNDHTRRVLWTDIGAARLHSLDPVSGEKREWVMPERLCCFALTDDDDVLLLGLASRLAFFNLATEEITPICAVEAELPMTRVNDGRCDREGRFVFGTLDESAPKTAIASFYRLNLDLTLERLPLPKIAISNSICFSLDGSAMYFTDSMQGVLYRWDGYASGDLGAISVFADVAADTQGAAAPDGATIDAEGYLWSAQWGGARVVRYAPDGAVERILRLPVAQPSCLSLGGASLDTLFVTSAQEGMTAGQLAAEPLAGALFHTRLANVRGVPEVRFGGLPIDYKDH